MKILALDTSMGACSAAILTIDGVARTLVLRETLMARGHAEALMPMVAEVMQESGTAFADLDLIAATLGPGSFTGVRIAIAAARGLALVTHAKLFGTDSLSVMARSALASGEVGAAPFAVAVDARRGMLYLGLYDEAARKLEGPLLIAPDEALRFASAKSSRRGGKRRGFAGRSRHAAGTCHRSTATGATAERRRARRDRLCERRDAAGAAATLSAAAGCKAAGASDLEALMSVEILVNRAMPFDASLLAALHASCFAKAWDEAEMAQFIAAPDTICLIASAVDATGGAPAGFLIARKAADEAELLTLCVLPAYRGLGLARALMREAMDALRSSGATQLFLEVEDGNQAALRLYSSLGAVRVGQRKGYYEHGADAAIFSLALSSGPDDDGAALARRQA